METRPNVKWASLSYVWGGPQETRTTRTTLSKHLEGIEMDVLPQTLVDAIKVCRGLDIPYLWIDALCIIQDDTSDLSRELASMPKIYQEGYITIEAARAQGAQTGFLGKTVYSYDSFPPTQIKYESIDGRMGQVLLCQDNHENILTGDPINSRAWTFQEILLSPRSLRFTLDVMRWSCRSARRFDGNWKKADRLYVTDTYNWLYGDVPCIPGRPMPAWEPVVNSYSGRKMTNQSDRLVAISAIAKVYGDSNKHTYLAGLWKETLPLGLCWMVEQGAREPRPKEFRAPSWSWASIDTPFCFVGNWWIKEGRTKDGHTGLFIGQETVSDGVDVIEANLEPTSVGTEYFSIKSASLTIRAPTRLVKWDIDYRDGIGEISIDDIVFTGYADAWEDNWPDKETLLEGLSGKGSYEAAEENDDQSSVSSDDAYGSLQVIAMLISKSSHYDHGYLGIDATTTLGDNYLLSRCGILLVKDGQQYKRVGFFRGYVDEELYSCEAASLPGFKVDTIAIV
ncbi:hypothetical protein PFICI_04011 [Pestalotiopsis fici W106-1]|uniref:Heterokaryon incompatibility domain-containing protein n=1 Tax=Pestalotiopsis fici (strain W106-1 / CGMCC3.15140) TaxID=1229662 RepID=W3XL50_PESFW|nr:uncharacterized protein PFICI_04011 [Pestalotiopsis fici W106-1]ETS85986.1 hypothetical protein PFICI_04011 [Pestalotiopsis fici W106-1]